MRRLAVISVVRDRWSAGSYQKFPRKAAAMPIEPLIKLSAAILIGLAITHPMNVSRAIRGVEFSVLREITNTRSWGNPSIHPPRRATKEGRPHP
jgi:hypothetical protein